MTPSDVDDPDPMDHLAPAALLLCVVAGVMVFGAAAAIVTKLLGLW